MRYLYNSLTLIALICPPTAYAVDLYLDALYWQPSESIDWSLTNNLNTSNQNITYKTIDFNFAPGFRVGIGHKAPVWDTRIIYTHIDTKALDSATGNVTSAFMGGKLVEAIYSAGQVDFKINVNTIDVDLLKNIQVSNSLLIKPLIGLRGAWINQQINTQFQGQINVLEEVQNNFTGLGPKAAVENQWTFYNHENSKASFIAHFTSAYLWGNWSIHDRLTQSIAAPNFITSVGKRDFGAFTVQGLLGLDFAYKNYSLKLAYEIADWLNQYQVLDNATGTHNNDLVLQGLTLGFSMLA